MTGSYYTFSHYRNSFLLLLIIILCQGQKLYDKITARVNATCQRNTVSLLLFRHMLAAHLSRFIFPGQDTNTADTATSTSTTYWNQLQQGNTDAKRLHALQEVLLLCAGKALICIT
jgi:hypothetical protein